MPCTTRLKSTLALVLAYSACGYAAAPVSAPDTAKPEAIRSIERQGVEIMGEFDAPGGMRGFAGVTANRPLALYVTPDGQHVIVGTLLNAKGEDVAAPELDRLVVQPMSKRIWGQLERTNWVIDGNPKAPRVVYVFTDPNCPYCHRFWNASRRWVQSGKVQLRHILVGVIRADSANKAASILTAKSPTDALTQNEQSQGGIEGLKEIPADVQAKLAANAKLMDSLGFEGTPGILFRDDTGVVQSRSGMPEPEDMRTVLGAF